MKDRLSVSQDAYEIVECSQCRLIRLEPQPSLEERSRAYPADYWSTPEPGSVTPIETIFGALCAWEQIWFAGRALPELGDPRVILDIGLDAGRQGGAFLRHVTRKGFPHILVVDASLATAADATRAGVPAVCGDLSRAPCPPAGCSLITMFQVLPHLSDPAGYLDLANQLLAPGGRLVIQTPNASSWQFLLTGDDWSALNAPRSLFHFRVADLMILLDDCGFDVVRVRHFSVCRGAAMLASSLIPSFDPSVRRFRGVTESLAIRWLKDIAFYAITLACAPFCAIEAACRASGSVWIDARKRA